MSTQEDRLKKLQAKADSLSREMNPAKRSRLRAEVDSLAAWSPPPSTEHKSTRKKTILERIFSRRNAPSDPIADVERVVGQRMRGSIRDSAGRQADSLGIMQRELSSRIDSESNTVRRNKMVKKEVEVSEQLRKIRG